MTVRAYGFIGLSQVLDNVAMSLFLAQRALTMERMDVETMDSATVRQVLRSLERINRWIGGFQATLWHLERFAHRWPAAQTIHILDWGTGGADIPRAIVRWARRHDYPVRITGIDSNAAVVAYAREACTDFPEIEIRETRAELFQSADDSYDYAISSLTLHHLTDDQIVALLRQSHRIARRGIVMNDLKRSARAWAWIWAISRLTLMPEIVRHDGPLSVLRAFTAKELAGYAAQAGVPYLTAQTHFGYRLTLAGEKGVTG